MTLLTAGCGFPTLCRSCAIYLAGYPSFTPCPAPKWLRPHLGSLLPQLRCLTQDWEFLPHSHLPGPQIVFLVPPDRSGVQGPEHADRAHVVQSGPGPAQRLRSEAGRKRKSCYPQRSVTRPASQGSEAKPGPSTLSAQRLCRKPILPSARPGRGQR